MIGMRVRLGWLMLLGNPNMKLSHLPASIQPHSAVVGLQSVAVNSTTVATHHQMEGSQLPVQVC